ncbi:MAG TPA: chemotaxis protein CheD [bacterium]|nr:chemotaxis protein CheD [bacterium]HPN43967.1 chemotaxis protein CheD [bacterium]
MASETTEFYLYPGVIFAHREPHIVTTVLGSCVAVCLWDSVLNIGGINHYMLPLWNGNGLSSPKYGIIAIQKLIEKMQDLGSKKSNLKAKVFGGAKVLQTNTSHLDIGKGNIHIAEKLLEEEHIPIISASVGGEQGRKLRFFTNTGIVMVKAVNRIG